MNIFDLLDVHSLQESMQVSVQTNLFVYYIYHDY